MKWTLIVLAAAAVGSGCGTAPQITAGTPVCNSTGSSASGADLYTAQLKALVEGPAGAVVSAGIEACGQPTSYTFSSKCGDWVPRNEGGCMRSPSGAASSNVEFDIGNIAADAGQPLNCRLVVTMYESETSHSAIAEFRPDFTCSK